MKREPLTDCQIALLADGSMPDAVCADLESALASMAQEIQMHREQRPLSARVTRSGILTIGIGVNVLAVSALASPFAWKLADEFASDRGVQPGEMNPSDLYSIANAQRFAVEVKNALTAEREDGSSMLTDLLDSAFQRAYEDGSDNWEDKT